MRMRVTAPCNIGGEDYGVSEIGRVVTVADPSEASRLIYYGQAVPDETGGDTAPDNVPPDDGQADDDQADQATITTNEEAA